MKSLKTPMRRKLASLALSGIMLLGLIPTSAFGLLTPAETVTAVTALTKTEYEVEHGTPLEQIGLPTELEVELLSAKATPTPTVTEVPNPTTSTPVPSTTMPTDTTAPLAALATSAPTTTAAQVATTPTTTVAEKVKKAITWAGEYDANTAGTYELTAVFADTSLSFETMPSVTVTVLADKTTLASVATTNGLGGTATPQAGTTGITKAELENDGGMLTLTSTGVNGAFSYADKSSSSREYAGNVDCKIPSTATEAKVTVELAEGLRFLAEPFMTSEATVAKTLLTAPAGYTGTSENDYQLTGTREFALSAGTTATTLKMVTAIHELYHYPKIGSTAKPALKVTLSYKDGGNAVSESVQVSEVGVTQSTEFKPSTFFVNSLIGQGGKYTTKMCVSYNELYLYNTSYGDATINTRQLIDLIRFEYTFDNPGVSVISNSSNTECTEISPGKWSIICNIKDAKEMYFNNDHSIVMPLNVQPGTVIKGTGDITAVYCGGVEKTLQKRFNFTLGSADSRVYIGYNNCMKAFYAVSPVENIVEDNSRYWADMNPGSTTGGLGTFAVGNCGGIDAGPQEVEVNFENTSCGVIGFGLPLWENDTLTQIQYRSESSPHSWKTATVSKTGDNLNHSLIVLSDLGLEDNDYLVGLKYKINYISATSNNGNWRSRIYGCVKKANFNYMHSMEVRDLTKNTTTGVATVSGITSEHKKVAAAKSNIISNNNQKAKLSFITSLSTIESYDETTSNNILYLRSESGISFSNIKVFGSNRPDINVAGQCKIQEFTLSSDPAARYTKIEMTMADGASTQNGYRYSDGVIEKTELCVTFELITPPDTQAGIYELNKMVFWDICNSSDALRTTSRRENPFNLPVSEFGTMIAPNTEAKYRIYGKADMSVTAEVKGQNQADTAYAPADATKPMTINGFGGIDYRFTVKNNSASALNEPSEIYLPIAKKGENWGEMSGGAFAFDMALAAPVSNPDASRYKILYGIVTPSDTLETLQGYTFVAANALPAGKTLADVNCVKIVTDKMAGRDVASFVLRTELKDKTTTLANNLQNTMRPLYYQNVSTIDGLAAGRYLGDAVLAVTEDGYAKSTVDQLTGTKTLTGKTMTAGQFSFALAADATNPVGANLAGTTTATNDESGAFNFGDAAISFTAPGTYNFNVNETGTAPNGYTYDPATVKATFTVALNAAGNGLDITDVKYSKGGQPATGISFTNAYKAHAVKLDLGSAGDPIVSKTVTGKHGTEGDFSFELKANDIANPMPAGTSAGVKETTRKGAGAVSFGEMEFATVGTYVYTVTEKQGNQDGYTYDNTVFTLTVTVVDNGGNLEASCEITASTDPATKLTKAVFANTYKTAMDKLEVVKTSGNKKAKPNEEITYTIKATNNGNMPMTGVLIRDYVPEHTTFVRINDTIGVHGTIDGKEHVTWFISKLAVGETKELSFTVKVNENAPISFAIKNTGLYTITEDPIAPPANDPTDPTNPTNTDTVEDGTVAVKVDLGDKNDPIVSKTVTGKRGTEGNFTFVLKASDVANPMPAGTVSGAKETTIKGEGPISFGEIEFARVGTYVYTLTEKKGNQDGYTYDETVFTLTFTVKDNAGTLEVSHEVTSSAAPATKLTKAVFANTYKTAIDKLEVTKTANTKTAKPNEEITYTIKATNNGNMPMTGVLIRDYVPEHTTFVSINDAIGVHGTIGGKEHVTWFIRTLAVGETKELSFTVKVNQNAPNGFAIKNTALYTITEDPTAPPVDSPTDPTNPTNTETVEDGTVAVKVDLGDKDHPIIRKVVTGKRAVEGEFAFVLKAHADTNPMPVGSIDAVKEVTMTGEGPVGLGVLSFTRVGTYVYTVSEKDGGQDGYTYDKSIYLLTFTVTEEAGSLLVTIEAVQMQDPSVKGVPVTFTNEYVSPIDKLDVVKKASVDKVKAGDYITYTITVTNNSNAPMHGVLVRDYVPQYTLFQRVNDTIGEYGVIDGREHVTWFIKTLEPNQVMVLSFTVKVDTCVPSGFSIKNKALYTISEEIDAPSTNDKNDPDHETNEAMTGDADPNAVLPLTGERGSAGSMALCTVLALLSLAFLTRTGKRYGETN